MKKGKTEGTDLLQTPSAPLLAFGTGETAQILGIDIRRLQGYVDSPKYQISSTGRLGGIGKGSRRLFYVEDIYRLGITEHLVRNGFSYKFVSKVVQQLDDNDLLGPFDDEGQEKDVAYVVVGGEKNLSVYMIDRDKTLTEIAKRFNTVSCYFFDLPKITAAIQKRIATIQQNQLKGR